MDVGFVLCLAVFTAASAVIECYPDGLLTPYDHQRGIVGPWRSLREIRSVLQGKGFNDTFEEIAVSDKPISSQHDYEVNRFIDSLWREDGSRAEILGHLTTVSRATSTVSVTNPYPSPCSDKYWTYRSTVVNTASHRHCAVGMNAGFFRGSGSCLGVVVSDRVLSQVGDNKQNPVFAITDDGHIRIGYINADEIKLGGYRQAVSGVVWLVRNGSSFVDHSAVLESADHEETGTMERFIDVISARTAIGHDAHGNVMLMHIEGQTDQRGVNLREFAGVLISHGFVNAINLDGGGSATTVVNDVVASYPSDHCSNPVYRCSRKVSSIICVHDVECYPSDCSSHGVCTDGVCHCEQLYTGMGCEKLNCSLAHCSGQGTCNGGVCECEAGWTGTHCNKTCSDGTYGPDCSKKCSWCSWGSHTDHCERFNGTWMCEPGYQGYCCRTPCDNGWYGADCKLQCNCSSHGSCSRMTGACSCEVGWSGVNCSLNMTAASVATTGAAISTPSNFSNSSTTVDWNSSNYSMTTASPVTSVSLSNSTVFLELPSSSWSSVRLPIWAIAGVSILVIILLLEVSLRFFRRQFCIRKRSLVEEGEQPLIAESGEFDS